MNSNDNRNNPQAGGEQSPATDNPTGARQPAPYEGTLLDGRYLIERELGRGGIGAVFFARDQQLLCKPVVIKILLEQVFETDADGWVKKKFRQEVEALARIDHPGVVGVLQTGEMPDGRPYLVMQYIEGRSLRAVMKPEGMNLDHVAHIIRQIGQALTSAHDRGIYHRDLKPENIMLQALGQDEEHVKLIDFGVATVKDSKVAANRATTMVAGTVGYMAPEQLLGKPSAASDIYALGVIAYEMVTGRRPFNPDSPYELLGLQQEGVRVNPVDLRPSLPERAQEIILQALSFEQQDRPPRARDLGDELARALQSEEAAGARRPARPQTSTSSNVNSLLHSMATRRRELSAVMTTTPQRLRVALLYKRDAKPDDHVLQLLEAEFKAQGHEVFVDRNMSVGVEWAKEIERQVRTADAVIPLLSAASITSEMIAYEVQIAHEAAQQQEGKPRLLPVRINYEGALPDLLATILNPIQYASWTNPQEDARLTEELLYSLQAPESPKATLAAEPPGGAVPLDSNFYLVRPTDEQFLDAIRRRDSIVLIKGARQMGKTSLLARGLQLARAAGARVITTDLQKLNSSNLETIEAFFMTLGEFIADQLDLDVYPEDVWKPRRAPSINFERYMRREVLEKLDAPLVWGLDEVDRLFTCPFASEVFGLFRTWHNERAVDPMAPWGLLTLAIVYATEAHLFITDQNQSPFNVGTRLELKDFSIEQVGELNTRYGSPLKGNGELGRFFQLLSGHPYLVRRGLHEMVTEQTGLDAFEAVADRDEGPYGDHLRRILVLLARDPALCEVVRGVLRGEPCPTVEDFYRLRSAGVMAGESAQDVRPRCQLYATYLKRHLL
ncbi:MAG TPA: AAA-like domain-containing protein [Pyrinomonadaceae bacterium]|nr:AAA-like domain-containing protein [Pyrinomonadaceae bacterium]